MSAYWMVRCHVKDTEVYGKYIELAGPAIEKYGGRFLVRGGEQVEVEGEGYERTVLVEFNTLEQAKAFTNLKIIKPLTKSRKKQPTGSWF